MTEKRVEEVIIGKKTAAQNQALARQLAEAEQRKSTIGFIIGALCLAAGVWMIITGIDGSIDWTFKGRRKHRI
jgi:hypothetical protein